MKTQDIETLKNEALAMKLIYTTDSTPGFTREKREEGYVYLDTAGQEITDTETLIRIKSLALPPAWTKVWICPLENGHLQATGFDAANRKQYRYHPDWCKARNENKHNSMCDFGKALRAIRKRVEKDLNRKTLSKEKVLALAVSVMDKTFIRVGNSSYTKMYGSFGLTSLRDRHVKIKGDDVTIAFKGKKGVYQQIKLTHARLAKLLKSVRDIPGQELFQYYEPDGSRKCLDSGALNEYLAECTGREFTAKDFRTWWGTVTAAGYLAEAPKPATQAAVKKNINKALDFVAQKLGNTRAVCKKYYVHPRLLSHYADGKLEPYLEKMRKIRKQEEGAELVRGEEKLLMEFIQKECK
jgi:DNA topoisomerase I